MCSVCKGRTVLEEGSEWVLDTADIIKCVECGVSASDYSRPNDTICASCEWRCQRCAKSKSKECVDCKVFYCALHRRKGLDYQFRCEGCDALYQPKPSDAQLAFEKAKRDYVCRKCGYLFEEPLPDCDTCGEPECPACHKGCVPEDQPSP